MPLRMPTLAIAGIAVAVAVAIVLSTRPAAHPPRPTREADAARLATPAEMAAALAARGTAWVWPASNGPMAHDGGGSAPPLRQAAVLVESLRIGAGSAVERHPRMQPLVLPSGVPVVPVLHVESDERSPDAWDAAQVDAIVAAFARHRDEALRGPGLLQLDFEAPRRQRPAYIALVHRLRQSLPPSLRLGVTVLAHWCTEGRWLDELPVDEVVPMLYRLGPQAAAWRARWNDPDAPMAAACRGPALGFATNDPPASALLARTARPYFFDDSAWSNPSHPTVQDLP